MRRHDIEKEANAARKLGFDALADIGAPYVQMPATAEKIWRAVQEAKNGTTDVA